jgi:hypothetical protein
MQGASTERAPLIGRRGELDHIEAFVLAGAVGLGKTRLASEAAAAAAERGFATA